jgi:predicted ferric reductase
MTSRPTTSAVPGQARSPQATPVTSLIRKDLQGPTRPVHEPEATAYRARIRLSRLLWSVVFLALVGIPLVLAPGAGMEARPWSKGGIWVELCMTSGLLGLSTLAATLVLPSRVKSLTRAFGIEEVLHSHKWLGLVTTIVVVAHVLFIVADKPLNVLLLSPGDTGANRARAGLAATVAMALLCILSFRRKKMGTRYDVWRWVHVILAVISLVGTYMHIFWLNHLMQDVSERVVMLTILVAVSAVLINRWIMRPLVSVRHPYVVRELRQESPSVTTLVLSPAKRNQKPLVYRPGQFAWIRLDSPFGPMQGNPFSIASGEDSPRNVEFSIRNVGDFTSRVGNLTPGRKVYIDGPYGSFNTDADNADGVLLIAGGVGMAPIISILRSHAVRGDDRRHCLVMSAGTPDELLFAPELEELSYQLDLSVVQVVSKPPDWWRGPVGRIDKDLLRWVLRREQLSDPQALICASGAMMRDMKEILVKLGLPERKVHTEQFDMV